MKMSSTFDTVKAGWYFINIEGWQVINFKINNIEPVHEISNNVVCATNKASDQPVQMRSLIRAFAFRLSIL